VTLGIAGTERGKKTYGGRSGGKRYTFFGRGVLRNKNGVYFPLTGHKIIAVGSKDYVHEDINKIDIDRKNPRSQSYRATTILNSEINTG